jgi:hypothetical protein
MWCFQYLRMFVVFFFVVRFATPSDPKQFFRFLVGFALFEFFLNLAWKFHINPLPNFKEYWPTDWAVGTLNGCDMVAYFCIMILVLCLAIVMDPPSKKIKKVAAGTMVITLVNFMMTNTNHAYLILGGALLAFFVVNYREVKKFINIPALAGLSFLSLVFVLFLSQTDAGVALSPKYLQLRYDQFLSGPKVVCYQRNFTELPRESPYFWLVGHGPGQGGSPIGTALRRPIGNKYFNTVEQDIRLRFKHLGGSVMSTEKTGVLTYWSEVGPLGLLFLSLAYLIALRKNLKVLRERDTSDKYHLAVTRSLPSIFMVVLLTALIRDLFYMGWLVGVVWAWVALSLCSFSKKVPDEELESDVLEST